VAVGRGYCFQAFNEGDSEFTALRLRTKTTGPPALIAIFIASEASSESVALARSVHAAAREQSGLDLPLLSRPYNRSATTTPFTPHAALINATPRAGDVMQCERGPVHPQRHLARGTPRGA
jgi:hypothetical protein